MINDVVIVQARLTKPHGLMRMAPTAVCLEAFCSSASAPASTSVLTGSDPEFGPALLRRDTLLDACILDVAHGNFTWTVEKGRCDRFTVILHQSWANGFQSTSQEYDLPGKAQTHALYINSE